MNVKQHTKITIETHEVTVIRVSTCQTATVFCEICETSVRHFSILRSAAICRLSETAIFRLAESRQIHSTETADGWLLVCGNSLAILANEINRETGQQSVSQP